MNIFEKASELLGLVHQIKLANDQADYKRIFELAGQLKGKAQGVRSHARRLETSTCHHHPRWDSKHNIEDGAIHHIMVGGNCTAVYYCASCNKQIIYQPQCSICRWCHGSEIQHACE